MASLSSHLSSKYKSSDQITDEIPRIITELEKLKPSDTLHSLTKTSKLNPADARFWRNRNDAFGKAINIIGNTSRLKDKHEQKTITNSHEYKQMIHLLNTDYNISNQEVIEQLVNEKFGIKSKPKSGGSQNKSRKSTIRKSTTRKSRNQRAGAGKSKSECAGKVKSCCVEPCQWKSGEKRQYCAKKRATTTKTSKVKPGLKKKAAEKAYEHHFIMNVTADPEATFDEIIHWYMSYYSTWNKDVDERFDYFTMKKQPNSYGRTFVVSFKSNVKLSGRDLERVVDDLAIPDEDVNNPLHGEAVFGKVTKEW